jgi:hypothetical protein
MNQQHTLTQSNKEKTDLECIGLAFQKIITLLGCDLLAFEHT